MLLVVVAAALSGMSLACSSTPDPAEDDPTGLTGEVPDEQRLADLREPDRDRLFLELDKAMKTWRTLSSEPDTQKSLSHFLFEYSIANRGAVLSALESDVIRHRMIAAGALYFLGDSVSVEPLIRVLDDPQPAVVVNALMALGSTADDRVPVAKIVELVRHEDPSVRQNAALVLGRVADRDSSGQALEALAAALHDERAPVRFNAVKGLSKARDSRFVPGVLSLLSDPWPGIRAHAALTLAAIGDPSVLDSLRPLLKDESELVRVAVENAIASLESGVGEMAGKTREGVGLHMRDGQATNPRP